MKENIEPTRLFRKVKALREENKTLKEELTYFKEQNSLLRTRCRELTKENDELTLKVKDIEFTKKFLASEDKNENLFLAMNPLDKRWKVLDKDEMVYGDGASPKEAIQSARIVTSKPISLGSNQEISDGDFNKDELIEALSELAGMKIIECFDDVNNPTGYKMELVE